MPQEIERNVQLSVLDRLVDNRPDSRLEPLLSRPESIRRLRHSIRRDLEWLLNTSCSVTLVSQGYKELRDSLYLYGLPDISSVSLDNEQDEVRFLRSLETALAKFEPRLIRIRIHAHEKISKKVSALHFQIEAFLLIEPSPERVLFDTVLEIAKGAYSVKEDAGA